MDEGCSHGMVIIGRLYVSKKGVSALVWLSIVSELVEEEV